MYILANENFLKDIKTLNFIDGITNGELSFLGPVSKINFFVGANNTGKSTFLRNLLNQRVHKIVPEKEVVEVLYNIKSLIENNKNVFSSNGMISLKMNRGNQNRNRHSTILPTTPELKKYFDSGDEREILLNGSTFENLEKSISVLNETTFKKFNEDIKFINQCLLIALEAFEPDTKGIYREYKSSGLINLVISDEYRLGNFFSQLQPNMALYDHFAIDYISPSERIYIPILRTLITLYNASKGHDAGKLTNNIFEGTILKNYFKYDLLKPAEEIEIKISTGLDLFGNILFARNNERKVREGFDAFEKFLSKTFFSGKDVDIIARQAREDNEKHIYLYLDGAEHDIHKFGDGIQACILLLYPIFIAKDGAWIFIEEPELNMHPGFQRIFLTALLNNNELNKKNLKYFITTHSNHLLDLTLTEQTDVSIFTFRENREGAKKVRQITNVKNSDIDALELLGVNNSSVYLANCSIWVEGHSDTIFLRSFLMAYENELDSTVVLKEDLHYSFFEYSGTNVSHYLFSEADENDDDEKKNTEAIKARFLSNKILLIADRDSNKESKHELLTEIESKYFTYEVLSVREIENLLSPRELRILLPKLHSKLKSINWDGLKIKQNDYQLEYLGTYLKTKLKDKFPEGLKAKSGTFNSFYKKKLANLLAENISWETMSDQAKLLTKKVYKFITDNNSL